MPSFFVPITKEEMENLEHDEERVLAAIKARILPAGSTQSSPPPATKAIISSVPSSQQASLNKTFLENTLLEIESMQSNLESMKKVLTNVLNSI
jgi:hypothetical protein